MGTGSLSAIAADGQRLSTPAAADTTGIVVALASEARILTRQRVKPECITTLTDDGALWLSGMGPLAARRAAEALVAGGASVLAVFGVGGALSEALRNGTLFCPEHVLDEHGGQYATDASWHARLRDSLAAVPAVWTGALLSVAEPLLTPAAKRSAHIQHAALAVDMESAAVAAVAAEHQLPFVALRAIIDEAGDTLPTALNDSVDAWGDPRPLNLIAALCRHPSLLGELPRLYSRMQRATRALRTVVQATGPTLGWRR